MQDEPMIGQIWRASNNMPVKIIYIRSTGNNSDRYVTINTVTEVIYTFSRGGLLYKHSEV
jgi:hypothetical protein